MFEPMNIDYSSKLGELDSRLRSLERMTNGMVWTWIQAPMPQGGTSVMKVLATRYTAESQDPHPFEVIPFNDNGYKGFRIHNKSRVFDGLDSDGTIIDYADKDLGAGYVYVRGMITTDKDGCPTVGKISVEGPEAERPAKVKIKNKLQTEFNFVIASIRKAPGNDTVFLISQEAFTDYTLLLTVVNGVLCKVPFAM